MLARELLAMTRMQRPSRQQLLEEIKRCREDNARLRRENERLEGLVRLMEQKVDGLVRRLFGTVDGQCFHRAAVALAQMRADLPEFLRRPSRVGDRHCPVDGRL